MTSDELEALVRILIAKGKSHATLLQVEKGWDAYEGALDVSASAYLSTDADCVFKLYLLPHQIINNTPSADDEGYDRSVSFPVFSGLFAVLKMGAVAEDSGHTYERTLCERFVEQARLNGDPVHYGRALAMQAETLGRLGLYEEGLSVVDEIRGIYDIDSQHESICKAYGSDRVAQAFTHSVNFNDALGRTDAAFDACRYVIDTLVPKSSPGNIHNMFCLLYGVVVFLKENGQAQRASEIFQLRIVDAFEKHFGSGGSTISKSMFKPILMLLDLQGHRDADIENFAEYTSWALDEQNFVLKPPSQEVAWAAFSCSPLAIHSEICFFLSQRQKDVEKRNVLLTRAIELMKKSVSNTANLPYANNYAKTKLQLIQKEEDDTKRFRDRPQAICINSVQ